MRVEGRIVDVANSEIFEGSIEHQGGVIVAVNRHATSQQQYIMSGFIDAHVHIESSMLTPLHFGEMVIKRGTVAVVTDPHEIANVLGMEGINFMVESIEQSPIKSFPSIPSSVPATPFDVAGGVITAEDVATLAASGRFVALSEVMNVPGVLMCDEEVMAKLEVARGCGLPIDGHAPALAGDDLSKYIGSGISTDHECMSLEEAKEKIIKGMKILIREGSAAKNYETLKSLISTETENVMFCTDDSHPDEILEQGHIDKIVRRALSDGFSLFDTLRIACINPISHYKLDVGQLRVGDSADFIVVEDLENFVVKSTYINGVQRYDGSAPKVAESMVAESMVAESMVAESKVVESIVAASAAIAINNFHHDPIKIEELAKCVEGETAVIGLIKDEIVTKLESYCPASYTENLQSDVEADIAKIVYINRYTNAAPQVAFCRGFGLKRGAIASSIAHDSHNIVAVGTTDRELMEAINLLIVNRGGISICDGARVDILPLPIAGIMSDRVGERVAADYGRLQSAVRDMGSPLAAPFMTLSFLSLVVIPEVKIGERGLFANFSWIG